MRTLDSGLASAYHRCDPRRRAAGVLGGRAPGARNGCHRPPQGGPHLRRVHVRLPSLNEAFSRLQLRMLAALAWAMGEEGVVKYEAKVAIQSERFAIYLRRKVR